MPNSSPCRPPRSIAYLAPVKARTSIRGRATTRPGGLLRNSITSRKAGDEVETEPGFFEVWTALGLMEAFPI